MSALKYAFVARDETVLAEYSRELGAFRSVSMGLLERIPGGTDRVSFPYDGNLYNFLVDKAFAFCVVSIESKKQLAFAFLEKVKAEFLKEHGIIALDSGAGSLDRLFGPRLQYWMQQVISNPEEAGKLGLLQKKVDDIKTIMLSNIEEVIARGEKLADLDDKADNLAFEADKFKSTGSALRKKMWWQKTKWQVVCGGVVAVVLLIIALILYSVFK